MPKALNNHVKTILGRAHRSGRGMVKPFYFNLEVKLGKKAEERKSKNILRDLS